VSVSLLAHVAVQILAHGVLDPLTGNQEDGAPSYIQPVVGDALEVVDHQGRSHPPLRRTSSPIRRVGYELPEQVGAAQKALR